MIEVLSPAGSYDSFVAAVNAGADAIYLGGNMFGARAYANNFSAEEVLRAIDYAHIHDRKVYMTVNTLLKDNELDNLLPEYLAPYYRAGLDAVIVQDMGVLKTVRENFPEIAIHASTQMTLTGPLGARTLKELGAARIVTARELTLQEIKAIRDSVDIEIESFVHGALCYCYSGQCLFSSLIGGRSGNRGRCAQPCRLQYTTQGVSKHLLSPKDMCALTILPQVIEAGVNSLKIEGRMKSPEYTAGVVSMYRKYVDRYLSDGRENYNVEEQDIHKLMDLYNRGNFTPGYYTSSTGAGMMAMDRPNHQGTKVLKKIKQEPGRIVAKTLMEVHPADVFEITSEYSHTMKDGYGKNQEVVISVPKSVKHQGEYIYRIRNNSLIKEITEKYINASIKEKADAHISLIKGQEAVLTINKGDYYASVTADVLEEAKNQPATKEQIISRLSKTGNTEYEFADITVEMSEDIFVPASMLNDMRRRAIEELNRCITESYRRGEPLVQEKAVSAKTETVIQKENEVKPPVHVYVENQQAFDVVSQYDFVESIYLHYDMWEFIDVCRSRGKEVYLVLPHIFREEAKKYCREITAQPDGYVIKSMEEIDFIKKYMKYEEGITKLVTDYNMYTFNKKAIEQFQELGIDYDTAPLELNYKELEYRGVGESELCIYGYLPMMVSAQCVIKSLKGCKKSEDNHEIYIKDRKNAAMCVKTDCRLCMNTIYNAAPLNLIDKFHEINRISPKSLRIHFTMENSEQVRSVMEDMRCVYMEGETVELKGEYTRGHFNRGVM